MRDRVALRRGRFSFDVQHRERRIDRPPLVRGSRVPDVGGARLAEFGLALQTRAEVAIPSVLTPLASVDVAHLVFVVGLRERVKGARSSRAPCRVVTQARGRAGHGVRRWSRVPLVSKDRSQVNIVVPPDELKRWRKLRDQSGLSLSDLIRIAMRGVSITVRQDETP